MNEFWEGTKKVATTGYKYTSTGVKKVGVKLDESGVTEKVKTGAATVGTKTVEYGGIAYNKTKEGVIKIASNEKVQEISSKAYQGAKDVGTSVWGFLSKALNQNGEGGQGNAAPNAPPAPVHGPSPAPPSTASPSTDT